MKSGKIAAIQAFAGSLFLGGAAFAQDALQGLESIGKPVPGGIGFQPSATSLKHDIVWLDTMILWIITFITLFVTALLLIVVFRYNRKRNPDAAGFTHNSVLEVAWTLIPIVILIVIGSFSLPILFKQQEIPVADITIKATGNQWFWNYEYVDDAVAFDSYMLGSPATVDEESEPDVKPYVLDDAMRAKLVAAGYNADEFLLATDNPVVVPVGKVIVVQVTAADVIHAWTIPAFGVKQDGVPGRLAHLWFEAEKEGVYFGQCSELCGKDHTYMPITVKVVSEAAYAQWLAGAKVEFASGPVLADPLDVASAE
jgi:cytochrome c oxidase subunit II